ncbi:MAG: ATP-binding protein [candidate division Zixibacteria bacterium]|nr:ATP-binding protein [candidate division Zixibacteria bacterium]MDH3936514.1 ATP-binding protein [candidate division Zixibacteria bacterium]MDH4033465.1 ATP-binding protein [candidate division Zixibacteria bacterium]
MTYTGRIRVYLIVVAMLPPLLVMSVIYFHSVRQVEASDRQHAVQNLQKYQIFLRTFESELNDNLEALFDSESLGRARLLLQSGREDKVVLTPKQFGFDFMEIIDTAYRVVATHHRPGLLGESIRPAQLSEGFGNTGSTHTVEYDVGGPHAAVTLVRPIDPGLLLYTGRYLDTQYQLRLAGLLDAEINIVIEPKVTDIHQQMEPGTLYDVEGEYHAVLTKPSPPGFITVATFATGVEKPIFISLLSVTGLVAALSVSFAIGLGMFITNRVKREIDNLVMASVGIAAGDFTTPVMAYEEGEFSLLAESFNDMKTKLKSTQKKLATSEKIAAWQMVGRKLAHEIKNPLTPIVIGVDDLRRSYLEQLPQFDQTLDQTTTTIKSEVSRMTKLLEHFAEFARMSEPVIRVVPADDFVNEVTLLYRREVESNRLAVFNSIQPKDVRLDPDAFKQVLVNLIKNGLETADGTKVTVTLNDDKSDLVITVEDTGPGFTHEKLQNSFEPYISHKTGGAGLGLVICHRIVHDHGGTMELYNRPEGGGGVRITLPQ